MEKAEARSGSNPEARASWRGRVEPDWRDTLLRWMDRGWWISNWKWDQNDDLVLGISSSSSSNSSSDKEWDVMDQFIKKVGHAKHGHRNPPV